MQYLKDQKYYIDLYDFDTIKECLDSYWAIKDGLARDREQLGKLTNEQFEKEVHKAASYTVNIIKGERYRHRAEKVRKWMDKDRLMQEKYDNTYAPVDIRCKACNSPAKVTFKDLLHSYEDDARMIFVFECTKCKKRQVLFEDETEWRHEPDKCPKCNSPLGYKTKFIDEKDITIYSCSKCSYTKRNIYDFKKLREEQKKRKAREQEFLAQYRDEFCLNDKNGPAYIAWTDQMSRTVGEWKEMKKKDKDPVYQKVRQLKQLTVTQLKELIEKSIKNKGYMDLQFGRPEMEKYVIIPFTVQEADSNRKEYDSTNTLKKLIRSTLEGTNWRLMSEGIFYRLGYVYGRLKAYETEEDLVSLIQPKN